MPIPFMYALITLELSKINLLIWNLMDSKTKECFNFYSVNNFTEYYRQQMEREKLSKRKANERRAARKHHHSHDSLADSPARHQKQHHNSSITTPAPAASSSHVANPSAQSPSAQSPLVQSAFANKPNGGALWSTHRVAVAFDGAGGLGENNSEQQLRGSTDLDHKVRLLEQRSIPRSEVL